MRLIRHILAAGALSTSVLSACSPQLHAPPRSDTPEQLEARIDHGYGLLFDLLTNESKVADILAIKSASEPTTALLKDISMTAADAVETMQTMKSGTPPLDLTATGLPLVEIDARNRIANAQTASLLMAFDSFELKILLTQRSACEYAWALASSLAAIDPDEARAEAMSKVAARFEELLARVMAQLALAPQQQPVD